MKLMKKNWFVWPLQCPYLGYFLDGLKAMFLNIGLVDVQEFAL